MSERRVCAACGEIYDPSGTPHEQVCEGSREDLLARIAALETELEETKGLLRSMERLLEATK